MALLAAPAFALHGVAYTTSIVVNAFYNAFDDGTKSYRDGYYHDGPYPATVSVNVAALGAGTYSASLHCPMGVWPRDTDEPLSRSAIATDMVTVFTIEVDTYHLTIGHEAETWLGRFPPRLAGASLKHEDSIDARIAEVSFPPRLAGVSLRCGWPRCRHLRSRRHSSRSPPHVESILREFVPISSSCVGSAK